MKHIFQTVAILVAGATALIVIRILNADGVLSFQMFGTTAYRLWTEPLFELGTLPVTPIFLIKATGFVVLLAFASGLGRRFLKNNILARTSIDPGLQYALQVGAGYFIFIFGMIIGLQSVGLNLSSLAFITGIIGVGVGFGTQNIMNNFVSGLILLVERPIKVGDRIEVGDLNGDVVRIAARSTWVKTNDNVIIIVPNAEFISGRVTNWTANDRRIRIRVPLGIGYSSDPEEVRDLLLKIARNRPEILQEPSPDVVFTEFGDSSLNFELRVWTTQHLRTPQILKSELYYEIFRVFAEHNIELPFPQRDIHIRSISAPLPLTRAKSASD